MAKVAAPLVVTSVGAMPSSTNEGTWMPAAAMTPASGPQPRMACGPPGVGRIGASGPPVPPPL